MVMLKNNKFTSMPALKASLLAMSFLLLSGCFATTSNKTYYQLPIVENQQVMSKSSVSANNQLWLERFSMTDMLNGNGIVYQINDVQYVMAANSLWGSPIEQQLKQRVLDKLNTSLANWGVSEQVVGDIDPSLKIFINGFHGRFDGHAVIRGEWILNTGNQIIRKTFNVELPQSDDGYDALVKTLSAGWEQQLDLIVADIAKELPLYDQ